MDFHLIKHRALEIATKGHAGQKRKNGKDYITHPIAVAEIAVSRLMDVHGFNDEDRLFIYLLAIAHDLAEDTSIKEREYVDELLAVGLDEKLAMMLFHSLLLLHHRKEETYLDYILSIKEDFWATEVKLSDLQHNLSDLGPGSLRDKYLLAEWILEN